MVDHEHEPEPEHALEYDEVGQHGPVVGVRGGGRSHRQAAGSPFKGRGGGKRRDLCAIDSV